MNVTDEILKQFIFGASLGLSAALIPGPFISVVIAQTIKHDLAEGIKTTLSVFLTDIFFIIFSTAAIIQFSGNDDFLGLISIVGGIYLFKLAYDNLTIDVSKQEIDSEAKPKSLLKGALVLFLSPGSYLFWFTLAAPVIVKTYSQSLLIPAAFLFGIYLTFVGGNIAVALVVSKMGNVFKTKTYSYFLKGIGIALAIFGLLFIYDGTKLVGLVS